MSRPTSRGNVLLAALVLAASVGLLAFGLGEMSTASKNKLALVAGAENATESTAKTTFTSMPTSQQAQKIAQQCQIGYDFIVRETEKKESRNGKEYTISQPKISPTLDGKTEAPTGSGNQCPKTQQAVTASGRACDATWKCKVYYCRPASLLPKGVGYDKDEKEECIIIGQCSQGEACDKTVSEGRNLNLSSLISDASKNGLTPDQQTTVSKVLPSLPSEVSKGLLDSFETDALKRAEATQAAQDEAQRLLNECMKPLVDGANTTYRNCLDFDERVSQLENAQQANRVEQARLAATRDYAQSLKDNQKILDPKSVPSYDCPSKGPECNVKPSPTPGPPSPSTFPPNSTNPPPRSSNPLGNLGQLLGLARAALGLFAGTQTPSCTIKASPSSITQPGQTVTLSWQSQNAQQAYLSNAGQVAPSGSMQVQPQGATTYSLQVMGLSNSGANNPYGYQQQDPYCVTSTNPVIVMQYPAGPGCYNYRTVGGGYGSPYGGRTPTYGQCSTQVTVNSASTSPTSVTPTAQISCEPKIADVGMQVSISYACQNAAASVGNGFSTGNQLSGSAVATVEAPQLGSDTNTFGLTCSKDGVTNSAQCTVNINRAAIVLVANPKDALKGERVNLGWVTSGMQSCVISSAAFPQFTNENASNSSPSGTVKTPPLSDSTVFTLTCTTKSGGTKTADTTVEVH